MAKCGGTETKDEHDPVIHDPLQSLPHVLCKSVLSIPYPSRQPTQPLPFYDISLSKQYDIYNHKCYVMFSGNFASHKSIKLKSSLKGEGFTPRRRH
jgi:hypothetical protein